MGVVGFGPLSRIDGPLPLAQEHGLLAAASAPAAGVTVVTDVDEQGRERWLNGVAMYPYSLGEAQTWRGCGSGSDLEVKDTDYDPVIPEFEPITVYLEEICTSYRVWDQQGFRQRAVTAFEAVKSAAVAREFLTGEALSGDGQPYLADGNGSFPNGNTPTSATHGLTLLEQEIAKSGKQGIIHCSPMLATTLLGQGFALTDKTGVIRTINGIVVVADFGYVNGATPATTVANGAHPAAGPTEEWAYATGPIDIRNSEVFVLPETVAEALERGSGGASTGRPNSIAYFAEQYFLVVWDLEVQASVLVDRCLTTCAYES